MPATTALRCSIAALEDGRETANQWVGPARVDALWRDSTAYRPQAPCFFVSAQLLHIRHDSCFALHTY